MLLRCKGDKPNFEQIKLWSWDLCRAIGARHFIVGANPNSPSTAVHLARSRFDGGEAIYDGERFVQDGPDILPEPGEYLMEVALWTRYYGIGYERGDLITLCAIAEWCELNIPNCEVWYGGDSSGVCAQPWPESERKKLRAHLFSEEGRSYYGLHSSSHLTPPPCSLCVKERGMNRYGFGENYTAVSCAGCGKSFTSRDNGKTWTENPKDAT